MGYTRQLGQLAYLITFDGSGNITVPASLTQGSVTSSMLKADAGGKLVAAVAGTDFVAPAGLSAYVPTTRTITINGTSYDLSADRSWTIVSGVSSFNTRTGAITLTSGDVTTALGYTPVTNARTLTINGTTFDLSADRSWSIVAGLSSFNTRTGAITLLDTDVTGALGYTPVTNARTITINGTTFDLSANRTWVVDTSSVTTRVIQKFTATSSQTTFTITGGYTVGMVDVFLNGIKLDNATEFTASNGSTVVLASGAATGDIVEVYKYGGQFIANNTLRQSTLFTATAGQTTFTVNYSVGFVDVFYNGSKLDSSEFTATNGTSIVLGTACVLNDKVEVVAYNYTVGAFTGVGGSGTTNYVSKWTASGTLGNSLIFDNGTNVGMGTTNPLYRTHIITANNTIGLSVSTNANDSETGLYVQPDHTNGIVKLLASGGTDKAFGFLTGNTERIRITSGGNVGINNSTPTGKLHINSNDTPTISGTNPTGAFVIQSTASTALTMGVFENNPFYGWMQMRHGNLANISYGLAIQPLGGNVGIGTTTPNVSGQGSGVGVLTIKGSTSWGGVEVQNNANTADGLLLGFYGFTNSGITGNSAAGMPAYIGSWLAGSSGADNGAEIRFYTKGNGGQTLQRMVISNSGSVGIGTGTPNGNLEVYAATPTIISGASASGSFHGLEFRQNNTIDAFIKQLPQTGELKLSVGRNSSWGGHMTFFTDTLERMRITASGSVFVGGSSIQNSPKFSVIGNGVWDGAAIGLSNTGTNGLVYTMFSTNSSFSQGAGNFLLYNNNNGVNCLIVYPNGNYVFAGSNVSDARLKQDIKDVNYGLNQIMQLSPKSYNIKSENNLDGENIVNLKKNYGFIAQEVKNVLPEIVTGQETESEYLGLDYNSILAVAVKAIQEQQAQIEELKALING